MNKKLTVVINNLDDEFIRGFWKDAIKAAKKEAGGLVITPADEVHIDAELMADHYPDIFAHLIASISSGHLVSEVDKFFKS